MTTGTAQVWTLNQMNMQLTVSLRARRDTTQVMLGVSLRATWDTTLVLLKQANFGRVDIAVLDFSKAFDTVTHNRLLTKLKNYGIAGNTLSWIHE